MCIRDSAEQSQHHGENQKKRQDFLHTGYLISLISWQYTNGITIQNETTRVNNCAQTDKTIRREQIASRQTIQNVLFCSGENHEKVKFGSSKMECNLIRCRYAVDVAAKGHLPLVHDLAGEGRVLL